MQRRLYIDEAHTALDIFRFAVFLFLYDQANNCLIHFYKRFQINHKLPGPIVDLIVFLLGGQTYRLTAAAEAGTQKVRFLRGPLHNGRGHGGLLEADNNSYVVGQVGPGWCTEANM